MYRKRPCVGLNSENVMATQLSQLSLKGTSVTTAAGLCAFGGMFGGVEGRTDRFASINEQSATNLWAPTSYRHAKPGVGKKGG